MPTDLPDNQDPKRPESPNRTLKQPGGASPGDTSSFKIAVISGIPIRIHVTFLLLLAWFGVTGVPGSKGQAGSIGMAFIVLLFTCVLLHELAHAMVAKRYGVRTVSITLYPMGGIALLDKPAEPKEELWIALAGPTANFAIAAVLVGLMRLRGIPFHGFHLFQSGGNLVSDLADANLVLGAFNMIPAFPMDGGRVLRSLIARGTDNQNATRIAAAVGKFMAVVLGIIAVANSDFLLIVVALFVYLGAGQEANASQLRSLVLGHTVREAMQTEYVTLPVGSTLSDASKALLAGSQHDFPVVHGENVVGLLTREALMRGIAANGDDTYVAGVMDREFPRIGPDDDLESVLAGLGQSGSILVFDDSCSEMDGLIGMLTKENAIEFLMLQQLVDRQRRTHEL